MDDPDLRDLFERADEELELRGGSLDAVKTRAGQRTQRARVAAGAGALALFAVAGLVAVSLVDDRANVTTVDVATEDPAAATGLLTANDFEYVGSFTTPEAVGGETLFGFGGRAATINSTTGASMFITTAEPNERVGEISIPSDLRPHDGARNGLPTAELLQAPSDVTGGRGDEFVGSAARGGQDDFRIGGLEVADVDGEARLHWTAWQFFNVGYNDVAGHGHSSLDLAAPDPQGPWYLGAETTYSTAGYVFAAPDDFAATIDVDAALISGFQDVARTPDGSQGPPFYAYTAPAAEPAGARLDVVPLVEYPFGQSESSSIGEAAVFPGADWVDASDGRRAIVAVGNSMPVDPNSNCLFGQNTDVAAHGPQLALYDPSDLAAVAAGERTPDDVEPYEFVSLADVVVPVCGAQLTSISFDPASERIFIVQTLVTATPDRYDARPVIHVLAVG